ncbi:hypothetical protein Mterra_01116 [Calidithermus terrae]|uniref:Uncharacterized protein n=1 Tax=Calidithermus terrae TaxID=1408545 RepID=A0A399ESZ2_9DEIN|nr:hypothetical protein [Calidithermus terrae]RIH87724.1 hypothetical protein Mterra_01116 [Calidithermus terrae]
MGYPIVIGYCRGEALLDLEGLFRIVKLEPSYAEQTVFAEAARAHFAGVVLLGQEAFLFGNTAVLRTGWSEPWLKGLMRMVSAADPLRAEEIAERVFLRRIFAQGLQGLLELDNCLRFLEKYAKRAEAQHIRWQAFDEAASWHAWTLELEDIEARMQNLRLTLGRFAVRLGNRWLRGEHL